MAVMQENMAKQEFRISSLEDQLKIQDIEIKDLKSKMLKFVSILCLPMAIYHH